MQAYTAIAADLQWPWSPTVSEAAKALAATNAVAKKIRRKLSIIKLESRR
jgi:hypothetical protein